MVVLIMASFGAAKGLMLTPNVAPQHGRLIFPAGIDEATDRYGRIGISTKTSGPSVWKNEGCGVNKSIVMPATRPSPGDYEDDTSCTTTVWWLHREPNNNALLAATGAPTITLQLIAARL